MANVNAPFGLQLSEDNSGTPLELCVILVGDGTATFIGDAVRTASSSIGLSGGPVVKAVQQATATSPIYGVVQAFLPQFTTQSFGQRYRSASTAMYCLIKPANSQDIYRIQSNDAVRTTQLSDVGLNASLVVGSGSTITGQSAMQLDSNTLANTATLSLKLIGFDDRTGNTPASLNAVLRVRLNNIELNGGTGTVGYP